jgi:serine protease Do
MKQGLSTQGLGCVLLAAFCVVNAFVVPVRAQTPPAETSALAAVAAIEQATIQAIAKAEKSVVAIARIAKEETAREITLDRFLPGGATARGLSPLHPEFVPHEFGSGVILDKTGLILTSYHVLGELSRNDYIVWTQRRPFTAKVKAADPWLDVAVLQIAAEQLEPITLGDTQHLKKGQFVIALGNPLGIARDGEASAAWGILANLKRPAPATPEVRVRGKETLHQYGNLLQVDIPFAPGASGGALINLKGELIGLTTTLASLDQQDRQAGFAIPVDDDFKKALESLKVGRLPEYGFLGIAPGALAAVERQAGKQGAVVEEIVPGTPAARTKLTRGDWITHVNDLPVRDELDLVRYLSAKPALTEVKLTYQRADSLPQSTEVVLSKKYALTTREAYAEYRAPAWRGLRVEYSTAVPAFRELHRAIDAAGCVAVLEVEHDSPAWKAGLRSGQFISHVNDKRVQNPGEFAALVAKQIGPVLMRLTTASDQKLVREVLPSTDTK